MMGYAYSEEGVLSENGEYDPALDETETSGLYKGPFSHRPDHCPNEDWNEKMISHKLTDSLVGIIARRYIDRGVSLSDLIKEGGLGLAHALENFELEGGSHFSTYGARCIRRNIELIVSKPIVQSVDK